MGKNGGLFLSHFALPVNRGAPRGAAQSHRRRQKPERRAFEDSIISLCTD
jgi:hypothetical protein